MAKEDIPPSLLKNNYYELGFLGGLNFFANINNQKLGYSAGFDFIQDHYIATRFKPFYQLSGGEFQYNCIQNDNARNCLFKLGIIGSLRYLFENIEFLEILTDIKLGVAYSKVDINLESVGSEGSGFLAYTTISPGLLFIFSYNIGFRTSYSLDILFFQGDVILSNAAVLSFLVRF